jgi:hypothetical protein
LDLSLESRWVEFDAPLELLPWGRNTYTVLYLHDRLKGLVAAARTRRVEGRLDEVEVNSASTRPTSLSAPSSTWARPCGAGSARAPATWWPVSYVRPTPTAYRCQTMWRPRSRLRVGTTRSSAAAPRAPSAFAARRGRRPGRNPAAARRGSGPRAAACVTDWKISAGQA